MKWFAPIAEYALRNKIKFFSISFKRLAVPYATALLIQDDEHFM
jgi:hypothetical protein